MQTPAEIFIESLKSKLAIGDRRIFIKPGATKTIYVNFVNVPHAHGTGYGGGAELENNRAMVMAEVNGEKVTIKLAVSNFPRAEVKLRGKTTDAVTAGHYVAEFFNKLSKREPKLFPRQG